MLEAMEHDKNISIHALREESDIDLPEWTTRPDFISIHALREESDPHACGQDNGFINFYPRSP